MKSRLPPFFLRLRFATSAISSAILNLNVFGFSLKSICSPGFNCHGCPWATAACPIGVITYGSAMRAFPVFAIASILAFAAILGRIICSFVCPFGLIQDLIHKIPSPKIRLPRFFRYGKYAALVLFVVTLPYLLGFEHAGFLAVNKPVLNRGDSGNINVGISVQNLGGAPIVGPQVDLAYVNKENTSETIYTQSKTFSDITVAPGTTVELPTFAMPNYLAAGDLVVKSPQSTVNQHPKYQLYYCKLCPAGSLTATLPSYFAKSSQPWYRRIVGDWLRMSILGVFLILMLVSSRPFCRLFCPLGAIYALTARLSLWRMKFDKNSCAECGLCDKTCPMGLDVRKEVGGMECIACGDCIKVCPKGGIKRQFGI